MTDHPQPIAATLRAAAERLCADIDRASQKHRRLLLTLGKAKPYAELLAAIADEMDDYGPDEDGRGGPRIYTGRDGTRTIGLDMLAASAPHDLPAWTAAYNGAQAILGAAFNPGDAAP
jgi:hypothetical protein